MRGRRRGSAWLTWVSQRRRAGAGSHRAIQRRVCCSQVLGLLRGTRYRPQRPIRYGDGSGRARYGGYQYCAVAWCKAVPTTRSVPKRRCALGGGWVPCRHDRVHDRGCALPEHLSAVAVPPDGWLLAGPATALAKKRGGGASLLRVGGSGAGVFSPCQPGCCPSRPGAAPGPRPLLEPSPRAALSRPPGSPQPPGSRPLVAWAGAC